VAGLAFSFFVVPYAVVPAEIVDSTRERTSLMSWRMCFLGLAILASGGLAPLIVESSGGDAAAYRVMAVAMGAVALVGTLGAIYGTRRSSAANAGRSSHGSLRTAVRAGMRSRPFRSLFLAFVAVESASALALAGMPYLADHILGDPETITVLFLCLITPLMVTMPGWRLAAVRFGKRPALLAAIAVFAVGELGLLVLPLVPADAVLLVAAGTVVVAGVGFAGVQMLPQAMLGDTLAHDAATGTERRAGLLTGLWTAGETVAMALGAGVFGVLLAVTGFVSSTADVAPQQPAGALWGIAVGAGAVPVVCLGLAAWALSRFALTEAEVDGAVRNTLDN
jgi:GPH family glycoside/pentoside/hexuronide:cation symporter